MKFASRLLLVSLLPLAWSGCETEIDLNAPPRNIWAVYGVLNQGDSVQYVRISRGFLPAGDAFDYAKETDLNARGLRVTLSGGGFTYEAEEIDSVLKNPADGTFYPYVTLYKFRTENARQLKEGVRYDLSVTIPDSAGFFLRSHTTIPRRPRFQSPTEVPGPGQKRCLRQVNLEQEYRVEFTRDATAAAYELRAILDYAVNGQPRRAVYGPTRLFSDDRRCNLTGTAAICYQFREYEILTGLYNQMQPVPGSSYTYDVDEFNQCKEVVENLPDAFRFEVTAADTFLVNYQQANDPQFEDFSGVRPEYTNIAGSDSLLTAGIFGAYSTSFARAQLGPCSRYLLNLNNTPQPSSPCAF
ncbi:MAG: hypothetical protein NW241_08175 [Bacteroidia bacterium]|nr:hypothetical protein [Bacteroidia bacterium]